MDPNDHNVVLLGSQRVYKSTNNGVSYSIVSGDLTGNPPSLTVARTMGAMTISWPLTTGFVLDQSLTTTGVWSQIAFPYTTNANVISISTPTPTGNKFYRLRKP
jgi:hypothetical protein